MTWDYTKSQSPGRCPHQLRPPEYLPPTEVLAPLVEDFELPFALPMFEMEIDPELKAIMPYLSQCYLGSLEEPPILTNE
ncbi:hypothetical protein RHMOL_Rhmol07G0193900 [Rhododendron molle]|uniref:Uncharacterized protein n=1 Tax=Rhododendron molle TaxID=49168 RepID=A0ACC0N2D6_RHOML|nr:hypothetical protein RHMOL_Rhmol07G0193900 [Rhododendron molle]